MMKNLWKRIKALHHDEQGADMVEYILIVAAVALPLMGVIIYFRHQLWDRVKSWWEMIAGDSEPSLNG